ncbi:hypothetical protein QR680_004122 [Steinernema hermaphroditum]|uniref:Uncharacterized protein n=1 Tax=Steinernema hermaphroditum TaxID=289476 RepID=A0AA39HNR7_9BILA|nr:hypothetical protein QR680_004122 [Steinernema hermaphroditum]
MNPYERCCCDSLHITTGMNIIAVLSIIGNIITISSGHETSSETPAVLFIVEYAVAATSLVTAILALFAVSRQKAELLWPYLIVEAIHIVYGLFKIFTIFVAAVSHSSNLFTYVVIISVIAYGFVIYSTAVVIAHRICSVRLTASARSWRAIFIIAASCASSEYSHIS